MHKKRLLLFSTIVMVFLTSISYGQAVRLRSRINPDCGSSTTLKFADIWADGNIAVLGTYGCRGVFIIDVSNPDAPTLSSWYDPTPRQAFLEAIVIGNRGYFGSGGPSASGNPAAGDGVHIVDLTNPANPVLLGKVNASSGGGFNGIHEMAVFDQGGQRFLIANYNSFSTKLLKIVNVTDPANPVFVRDLNPTEVSWVHGVHVRGNRLYTSGWGTGGVRGRTEIYDISNITTQAPTLLGFVEDPATPASGNNMHSSWTSEDGNFLYSAREVSNSNGAHPGDVRVYDISNPATPLLTNRVTMNDLGLNAVTPHNPVVMGNKLYVSWYQAGVQVFDISEPDTLSRIGQYDTYSRQFTGVDESLKVSDEPWDIICGSVNLQNSLPTSFEGTWAVFPFLGEDKVLIGEMGEGLFIVDVSKSGSPPDNEVSDFDGDGLTDLSLYRPNTTEWLVSPSSAGGVSSTAWGAPGDIPVMGDFDGDGKSDRTVFRPSNGVWYTLKSSGGVTALAWGMNGDIPVPGDYDADGRTDVAVYRPSTGHWYLLQSTLGVRAQAWGASTDKPLTGDFDRDGKSDLAVYRPSNGTWYVFPSSNSIPIVVSWGIAEDLPVSADFNGDGNSDLGVYRPSLGAWYVYDLLNQSVLAYSWGAEEDIPVPADYDGDSKADVSVFRPSEGNWYWIRSSDGAVGARSFGGEGDIPIPSTINPN